MSAEGLRRVHLAFDGGDRASAVAVAQLADRLGFGGLWFPEGTGRDVFVLLTEIALATRSIELGTGITNAYARTPGQLAMATASLADVDPTRRINLGIGASTKVMIEGFHGVPFERPAERMSELIDIVRQGVAGGSMGYEGEIFTLDPRFRMAVGQPADDRVRIFVGGLSPRMLRVLGTKADGWLGIWPSRAKFQATLLADMRDAAARASRPVPQMAAYLYTSLGTPPERADDMLRQVLVRYMCGSGDAYTGLFRRYGYTQIVDEALSLWGARRRDEAAAVIPESLLEDLCLRVRPEEVPEALESFQRIGVETPVLRFLSGVGPAELEDVLTKIASAY